MVLAIQCAACCLVFTAAILPAQFKDPMSMIMSYPPAIIKRVEELPQCQGIVRQREKAHLIKKLGGLVAFVALFAAVAYLSGCKRWGTAFIHVFTLFAAVNLYDLVVLDWGVFCHSRRLRIAGTEDMDKAYKNYGFHIRGAVVGFILGAVVASLSGGVVHLISSV